MRIFIFTLSILMVFRPKSMIFMDMNTGVYHILNLVNNKFYIGSTATLGFIGRWKTHRNQLRINKHPNPHLQSAWNKYGELQFKFEIIEECLPEHCVVREQHYFNIDKPQYNILTTAGSVRGYRHSDAAKALIGAAATGENHPLYSGEHRFYHLTKGIFEGSIVSFWKTFKLRKSLPYKLSQRTLDKSHGWIYLGTINEPIPKNLAEIYQSRIRNNRPLYHFSHKNGETFYGTMPDFVNKYQVDRSTICKLVLGKRTCSFGWTIKT